MAQVPKEHVRVAILQAAAAELAELGPARATLAAIAARAGTSVGNLYKYFPSKEALFSATVPRDLVTELKRLFRERVRALGAERDTARLTPGHPYRAAADALMQFSLGHRQEILFLLRHAEGTPHAAFRGELERELVTLAIGYAQRAYPAFPVTPAARRALRRIYRAFIGSLAALLEEETRAAAAVHAAELLVTYHHAGLRAFFASTGTERSPEESPEESREKEER